MLNRILSTLATATVVASVALIGPAGAAGAPGAKTVPHCTNADFKVSFHHKPGGEAMNQRWGWLVIHNRSHHTCVTGGFGGVSYVGGGNGTRIGAAAKRTGTAHSHVLEPGQRLRSLVHEVNAGLYDKSTCHPRHVDGFRVYVPNATRSQYVPHPTTGCASTKLHLID
ncbi:MAG TPA: DUF4232 domain-containing protein, partial [Marmoricola sp.]